VPVPEVDVGAAPLSLEKFQAGRDWAREISIQEKGGAHKGSLPAQTLQAGNLAALEEGEEEIPAFPMPDESPGSEITNPSVRPDPIAPSTADSGPPGVEAARKGSSGAVAFVVVLVVLMVTAGAYYTGLLGSGPR
jgi:hypothetical protein